jgi:Kef-type K+ transport system membrane component KefB
MYTTIFWDTLCSIINRRISSFFHIVLTLGLLLFASKLFVELFHRIKMPVVLGDLLAGFFGAAVAAAFMGLSPIVGAFTVGMAVDSTRLIKTVEEYVEKLQIIFGRYFLQ